MATEVLAKVANAEVINAIDHEEPHQAVRHGNKAITRLIFDNAADLEAVDDWALTPLLTAILVNDVAMSRFIVELGATPDKFLPV